MKQYNYCHQYNYKITVKLEFITQNPNINEANKSISLKLFLPCIYQAIFLPGVKSEKFLLCKFFIGFSVL
jgi:hypothetical protein